MVRLENHNHRKHGRRKKTQKQDRKIDFSAIAGLSDSDRKKLFKKFSLGADKGIEKNDGVMGGVACIRNTRIPVWLLFQARKLGMSEGDLLKSYPGLTAGDLVNAWDYVDLNAEEIELQIRLNERDD